MNRMMDGQLAVIIAYNNTEKMMMQMDKIVSNMRCRDLDMLLGTILDEKIQRTSAMEVESLLTFYQAGIERYEELGIYK